MSVTSLSSTGRQTYVLEVDDGISDHVCKNLSVQDPIVLQKKNFAQPRPSADNCATLNTRARSACDVVMGRGKLVYLGRRHGQRSRTCPWRRQLLGPLFIFWAERDKVARREMRKDGRSKQVIESRDFFGFGGSRVEKWWLGGSGRKGQKRML
jgi:hypothetical protein